MESAQEYFDLNAVASENIYENVLTDIVFHFVISWLNCFAERNKFAIFVTELTSQFEMSELNVGEE